MQAAYSGPMLHALLDANLRFGPEYRGHLSNHLPMALHALHALGASPQRLQDFYAAYAQRLQPAAAPESRDDPCRDVDWLTLRGQHEAHALLLAYFHARIAQQGIQATLAMAVPALQGSLSAALFHGAIRTAHAWQSGHARELAAALAYWACRWEALPAPPLAPAPAASLQLRIAELAAVAARAYAASPNFKVLHLITGMRAARVMLPWMEDTPAAQAVLAQHFFAVLEAAQLRPRGALPAADSSWPQAIAAAIASDDEHVIKLVHACRDEAEVYGEGVYLLAASRWDFL